MGRSPARPSPALALLTAAGLFIRGAWNAASAAPGFALDREIVIALDRSLSGYDEAASRAFYHRVLERVRGLPGVETASLASLVPFGNFTGSRNTERAGGQSAGRNDGRTRAVGMNAGTDGTRGPAAGKSALNA